MPICEPIGILHNEGLDFIINNLDPDETVDIERINELTSQFMQNTTEKTSKLDVYQLGYQVLTFGIVIRHRRLKSSLG